VIVLVCGGRGFTDKQFFNRYMDNFHWTNEITKIVHGNCPSGADQLAEEWATVNRIQCKPYNADWEKHAPPDSRHKNPAGMIRNREMLDSEHPDIVIAFPGHNGTKDMVDYAKSKNVDVLEVEVEGW